MRNRFEEYKIIGKSSSDIYFTNVDRYGENIAYQPLNYSDSETPIKLLQGQNENSYLFVSNVINGFEDTDIKVTKTDHNDSFNADGTTKTNRSGGIQGGISNGMDIYFNVAFKPVSTIMRDQDSIDSEGNEVKVTGKGRHDPCVVPRAVPIVEAMSALVLADYLLLNRVSKI